MIAPDTTPLPRIPARDPRGHKGTFGTVAVLGGCAHDDRRMIGAAALAATAALRAGAGLARLVMPAPVLDAGLTICPSATGTPIPVDAAGRVIPHEASAVIDATVRACECLVIGPGLGASDGARTACLRAVQQEETPVVVDADAINLLAEVPALVRDIHAAAVFTPHPGEYTRLAGALAIRVSPTDDGARPDAAAQLAQRLGSIVVLKGARTAVSDGQRTWVNDAGGPYLATAGTGDVLAGLLAGLIAQFVSPPLPPPMPRPKHKPLDLYDAARLAVHIHGLAGQSWADSRRAQAGLLAPELADAIPAVVEHLRA